MMVSGTFLPISIRLLRGKRRRAAALQSRFATEKRQAGERPGNVLVTSKSILITGWLIDLSGAKRRHSTVGLSVNRLAEMRHKRMVEAPVKLICMYFEALHTHRLHASRRGVPPPSGTGCESTLPDSARTMISSPLWAHTFGFLFGVPVLVGAFDLPAGCSLCSSLPAHQLSQPPLGYDGRRAAIRPPLSAGRTSARYAA